MSSCTVAKMPFPACVDGYYVSQSHESNLVLTEKVFYLCGFFGYQSILVIILLLKSCKKHLHTRENQVSVIVCSTILGDKHGEYFSLSKIKMINYQASLMLCTE